MQRDEHSHVLKFDLKEKILRTISEVQNNNSSDIVRENVLALHEHQDYFVDWNDETSSPSRSLHESKGCYTKTNTWNVLFLNTFRFFLIVVTLLLFGYNLLASNNEFSASNY